MFKAFSVFVCVVSAGAVLLGNANAQTAAEVNGEWRGESSGNVVTVVLCPGGIDVRRVTNNPGQSEALFYPQTGAYQWTSTVPGADGVVHLDGALMSVLVGTSWRDNFRRTSVPANLPPCSRGGNGDVTTPSAPIARSTASVGAFHWFTPAEQSEEPGRRDWSRVSDSEWIERYPSGHTNRFRVISRTTVDGCAGILLDRLDADIEAFIPDRGCANMWLRWRQVGGSWGWSGEMLGMT